MFHQSEPVKILLCGTLSPSFVLTIPALHKHIIHHSDSQQIQTAHILAVPAVLPYCLLQSRQILINIPLKFNPVNTRNGGRYLKRFQELAVLPTPPLNNPHLIILAIHSPPLMLSFHNSRHSALPHILQ